MDLGYKIQDMEKAVSYKQFYEQNKELLVHRGTNIIIALKERMRIKNKNMREYRARTMRSINQNDEHWKYKSTQKCPNTFQKIRKVKKE